MRHSENRIIALSPGTREFGVAVFAGDDLLYYATKDLKKLRRAKAGRDAIGKAIRVVEDLTRKHRPRVVVFRGLTPHQQRCPGLSRLTKRLKVAARRRGLIVRSCAPTSARKLLCPGARATRRAAASRLAQLYPELSRHADGVSPWQRLYYAPMFDAVALGYFHQQAKQRPCDHTNPTDNPTSPSSSSTPN
jgi:hypothetical protein